ncbi:MAG: DMT family transporter [Aestuariivirgaceae bacterium]
MVSAPLAGRDAASSRASAGISLMLFAMAILPIMDAIGKHLGQLLPILLIVWGRMVFSTLFTLPAVLIRHDVTSAFTLQRPAIQVARSVLMVFSTMSFFSGLRYLPIADTLAIFFIMPLVVTALSPLVLGEQVGVRRWSAVVVGFIGTLIIIRPGFHGANVGTLWALASGLSMALYMLLTRKIAGAMDALVNNFQTTLIGAILASFALPVVWQPPGLENWGLLAALGAVAAVGHYAMVRAYDYASAPTLAPLAYTEMVSAAVIGYLVFGDLPDGWTILGVAILIASAIYISYREGRLGRPRQAGDTATM